MVKKHPEIPCFLDNKTITNFDFIYDTKGVAEK